MLREEYGIGVVYAWRSFGARSASPADAAVLAIPAGSALVVRDGLSLDGEGRPTVFVHRRCRGDRMTFVMRYT